MTLERRDAARIRSLNAKLRKMVGELKDSTHYDKTQQLLRKYDPDFQPPKPATPAPQKAVARVQVRNAAGRHRKHAVYLALLPVHPDTGQLCSTLLCFRELWPSTHPSWAAALGRALEACLR